jgi:acyl-CoA reductase-like NAD-dependent aldehyde dehydrogenase
VIPSLAFNPFPSRGQSEMPETLEITDPSSGEVVARLPADDDDSIARKAARARSGQSAWSARPLEEREECLKRFQKALQSEREQLARTLTMEVGKPITQARAEITACGERIEFFLHHTAEALEDETVFRDPAQRLEERISWEPLGVVANISAWNYPYFVGSNVFVPALLTGNSVVYKPSEFAALSGAAIVQLMHEAGVPEDVMIGVTGAGQAGAALLRQPVDAVFFTGSYPTGRAIARAVAERLIHVQLELGGKDPVYVCDDAPVASVAAAVADGAFYNTGQSCCAVERVYVHHRIFGSFLETFLEQVRGFRMGDPMSADTYIGPLARRAQMAVLQEQVDDAVARGARLVCGGEPASPPGFFFQPTVLVDVDSSMRVMREESFGPVIGLQAVADDEEAVARMRDTEYGLTAGIYTPDRERAEAILARMDTGSVYWNCCDRVSPRLPWSGRRHSGQGVTLGRPGIRAFTRPKAWHLRAS